MRSSVMTALMLAVLTIIGGCATPENVIRIGGGDAALTGFITPVKETFEEENGIRMVVMQSKPGSELVDLQKGSVDAVVSAVSVDKLMAEAAHQDFSADKAALREVPIGKNETVIFLNKGIKIRKLTKKQLKEIFTGRITNWKRAGGPNRHIIVVWNPGAEGENDAFVRKVLHGEPVVATFHPAATAEEMRKKVLETPGAIGIGPNALIARGVHVPKSPKVASSVVFITKGEPSPKVQKLIDLLKDVELIP